MTKLLDEDRARLAKVLGMKTREIVATVELPDVDPAAVVVQTHDGQLYRVDEDGQVEPWTGPLPEDCHVYSASGDVAVALDPATTPATIMPPIVPDPAAQGDDDDLRDVDPDQAADAIDLSESDDADDDGDDERVPVGNAEVVLAWVGDNPDRATAALAAEQAAVKPRATLSAQLEKLANLA